MADPLTITAGVIGILASISTISTNLGSFGSDVAESTKEIASIQRELDGLSTVLPHLRETYTNSPGKLPSRLVTDLSNVLQNCNKTIIELDILLRKSSTQSFKGLRWAFSKKRECIALRQSLETYKSTISLSIILMTKDSNDRLREDVAEILALIKKLRDQLSYGAGSPLPIENFLKDSEAFTKSSYIDDDVPAPPYSPASPPPQKRKVRAKHSKPSIAPSSVPSGTSKAKLEQRAMKDCILGGVDVKLSSEVHRTALHAACALGDKDLAALLISMGADVNATGGYFATPLAAAAYYDHIDLVSFLFEHGSDARLSSKRFDQKGDHCTLDYENTLTAACGQNASTNLVELLVRNGADVNVLAGKDGNPLMGACRRKNVETVQFLLDNGAKLQNAPIGKFYYPLKAAVSGQHLLIDMRNTLVLATLLLDYGADANLTAPEGVWKGFPHTALQAACLTGWLEIVEFLLQRGADPNLGWETRMHTVIDAAISATGDRQVEMVRFLISHGAKLSTENKRKTARNAINKGNFPKKVYNELHQLVSEAR